MIHRCYIYKCVCMYVCVFVCVSVCLLCVHVCVCVCVIYPYFLIYYNTYNKVIFEALTLSEDWLHYRNINAQKKINRGNNFDKINWSCNHRSKMIQ